MNCGDWPREDREVALVLPRSPWTAPRTRRRRLRLRQDPRIWQRLDSRVRGNEPEGHSASAAAVTDARSGAQRWVCLKYRRSGAGWSFLVGIR